MTFINNYYKLMGNQTVFDSGIPHGSFTGGLPEEKI
jgi:hypothetical protein